MTTATAANQKAEAAKTKMIAKVKAQSTEMLCSVWADSVAKMGTPEWEATTIARGFVMDELEARDAEAFMAWIDSEDVELADYPAAFFLKP